MQLQNSNDAAALLRNTDLEPENLAYALRLLGYSASEDSGKHYDALVGGKYLFRSVTMYVVGKVESRIGTFIKLTDASWVEDTGNFSHAVATGDLLRVEPTGDHYLNLETVVDFVPWNHKLPRAGKR